jgi:hypothetical protein
MYIPLRIILYDIFILNYAEKEEDVMLFPGRGAALP